MSKQKVLNERKESTYSLACKSLLNADQKTWDAYIFGKYGERRKITRDKKTGKPLYERAQRRLAKNKYSEGMFRQ